MRNTGASPLHNVRMIISHPDIFCPLLDEELQTEASSALSGKIRLGIIYQGDVCAYHVLGAVVRMQIV